MNVTEKFCILLCCHFDYLLICPLHISSIHKFSVSPSFFPAPFTAVSALTQSLFSHTSYLRKNAEGILYQDQDYCSLFCSLCQSPFRFCRYLSVQFTKHLIFCLVFCYLWCSRTSSSSHIAKAISKHPPGEGS